VRRFSGSLLKIKSLLHSRKPTLIEIYEFNTFCNLEFGIEYEQEEDFNVNPRDISKALLKGQSMYATSTLHQLIK
jgi:hypothetical protein